MRFSRCLYAVIVSVVTTSALFADGERDNHPENVRRVPREGIAVPADREDKLRSQLTALQQKIGKLRISDSPGIQELLPDILIFERAVRCALDHHEFFSPKDIDKADALLDEGLSRADQLGNGDAQWTQQSGLIVRGYISRIDNTVQPYGLVIPETYNFSASQPTRCDLWFHGRGETLSEVNFLWDRMKNPGRYTPDDTIVLHPYGRYSNAFKFAGETDVLEALDDVQQRYHIDEDRISVRGFSMGGAACWQFAVHYADRWFAANPGAGFSETPKFLKFFQKETLNPTPWEKALWNLYDCNQYALNLIHCPTIAYSGENDIQKQAADVMEDALQHHGIKLRHIIGAKMGHTIDKPSRDIIDAGLSSLAKSVSPSMPSEVHLQTHTLKYNRMHWVTVTGLNEHWTPTQVTASVRDNEFRINTTNVRSFEIDFPPGTAPLAPEDSVRIVVDRQVLPEANVFSDRSFSRSFIHDGQRWILGQPSRDQLRKRHGLQGPIDDAFMDSFVFVRPTGTAASDQVGKWAAAELERAIVHWRRHFRGDARVIDDADITNELIQSANLVLWGDPSSNSVLGGMAEQLPVRWTKDQITVGEKTYSAADHVPILIYPNPLNQDRYVVLNSSFTFRDYAYLNNARQVPMLPDWAVINLKTPPSNVWPGKVVAADFFDEEWKLK